MASRGDRGGLGECAVMAFVPSADLAAAEAFYVGVLRLRLVERTGFALVLESGGTTLRVARSDPTQRAAATVAGWLVPDIEAAADDLAVHGVEFLRYDGLEQDERGLWTTPAGARVAWFLDPDANVLSLTEVARPG